MYKYLALVELTPGRSHGERAKIGASAAGHVVATTAIVGSGRTGRIVV